MSCFILDKTHIDLLVDVFELGPSNGRKCAPWGWYSFALTPGPDESYTDNLGRVLWDTNVDSYYHRYEDAHKTDPDAHDVARTYRHQPRRIAPGQPRMTPVQALRAISSYQYQSCEHPEWETSLAKRLTDDLRIALIQTLPGYDSAPWQWQEEDIAPQRKR